MFRFGLHLARAILSKSGPNVKLVKGFTELPMNRRWVGPGQLLEAGGELEQPVQDADELVKLIQGRSGICEHLGGIRQILV